MTDFKELIARRRSHRKFTTEEIDSEDVEKILRAALMSPSSKSKRDWLFIVVDENDALEKLADAKDMGGQFLKDSVLAIAVLGNPLENDCWVEDCSIAAISMQYQAEELGLGSCWVQIRNRGLSDGTTADEVVKGVLGIPEDMQVLCVVAFGHKLEERRQQSEEKLKWENVHINSFGGQ